MAEVIRFGIVTFSDTARTVLPLADLALVESMPTVEVEGRTSYAAAFDHLRRVIEADYHAGRAAGERWYRPAVLFVSDGRPTDPEERWRDAHRRLVDPAWRRRPNILAFGFGEAVPEILAVGGREQAPSGLRRCRRGRPVGGRPRAHGRPCAVDRQLVRQRFHGDTPISSPTIAQHASHTGGRTGMSPATPVRGWGPGGHSDGVGWSRVGRAFQCQRSAGAAPSQRPRCRRRRLPGRRRVGGRLHRGGGVRGRCFSPLER